MLQKPPDLNLTADWHEYQYMDHFLEVTTYSKEARNAGKNIHDFLEARISEYISELSLNERLMLQSEILHEHIGERSLYMFKHLFKSAESYLGKTHVKFKNKRVQQALGF